MSYDASRALDHDVRVQIQRARYVSRPDRLRTVLDRLGVSVPMPDGGLYLWVLDPHQDAWAMTRELAERVGIAGRLLRSARADHIRIAAVAPDDRIRLVAQRAGL